MTGLLWERVPTRDGDIACQKGLIDSGDRLQEPALAGDHQSGPAPS